MIQLETIDLLPGDDPTSVYYGLSVEEQKILAKIRRGCKNTPKAMRRKWKKPDSLLYASILKHCVEALLHAAENETVRLDRVYVYLRLPFNFRSKTNKNFPRPYPLGYDDYHIYVRYSADRIIDYLHSIGETAYTARELRRELWAINRDLDKLLWLDDVAIDLCYAEELDKIVPAAQAERAMDATGKRRHKRRAKKENQEQAQKMLDNPENV